MADQLQHELKKEFQLERMILFSDAVFAIAITLLVLEIKIPSIDRHVATDDLLLHHLVEMIPKFIGFLISFFIIGLYWTVHHRIFGFVIDYNRKLLWLNLIFLLAIVLMPFSTGFYSEYVLRYLKTPIIIYVSNITFLGIMNFILWKYVTSPERNLTRGISKEENFYFSLRAIVVPCMFVTMAILYLTVDPRLGLWIPMLVPVVMRLIRKRFKNKLLLK